MKFWQKSIYALKWLIYPCRKISPERLRRSLQGKTIVVTGASKGIGQALVHILAEAGVRLVLIARDESGLSQLCRMAKDKGCDACYYAVDLRDRDALAQLCDELREKYPEVDFFFCNAGKSICRRIENAMDRLHDYDRTMDVNCRSLVALSLAMLPSLVKAKGHIIYTSSVSTLYPAVGGWSAYHASKSAANMWCQTASAELRRRDVMVQVAYMPLVHTGMSDVNPMYKDLPGYSASEAAVLLLRLALSRRKSYMPWWARLSWKIVNLLWI